MNKPDDANLAITFAYPYQRDNETGAEYFDRLHRAGFPMPWETDKTTPPGPVTVSYEWSVRPPDADAEIWPTWLTFSETEAKDALKSRCVPGSVVVRRVRWVAVGKWEDQ